MTPLNQKKIGIWGQGATGAAAIRYALQHNAASILLFDDKKSIDTIQYQGINKEIICYQSQDLDQFLHDADVILKSPGVPHEHLSPEQRAKIISEFDLFALQWHKKIIGITGTVGKTTITSCLTQLLTSQTASALAAGNIGTPMLSISSATHPHDYAVIELSSFQTELGLTYAPDLAIITNIYPNHLDRHGTLEQYEQAKLNLIRPQKTGQKALLPLSLAPKVRTLFPHRSYVWFSQHEPRPHERHNILRDDSIYYYQHNTLIREREGSLTALPYPLSTLTFPENILIMTAALDQLGIDCTEISWATITVPEHRLRQFARYEGITFYNDSKSTIPAATLAAVAQITSANIIVCLGGLSKGVDRKPFIKSLAGSVKRVLCFGAEAQQLALWCHEYDIPAYESATLERVYHEYLEHAAAPGDHVLFSPAGASFDLFKNYEERGEYFMKLVHESQTPSSS